MILVLGGTVEGREIAGALARENHEVILTVVSGYGAEMIPENAPVEVLVGRLDDPALNKLISERAVKLIVDATHPYAGVITDTAWNVARQRGITYIRYERPPVLTGTSSGRIFTVPDYEEAARLSTELGRTIFLTIGSKNIGPFIRAGRERNRRVIARVLPDPGVLRSCLDLGMEPNNIIAIQGPFSIEMNLAMLREYKADVLVTKDSGFTGGTDTKLAAAAELGIPAVVIERPGTAELPVTDSIAEILNIAGKLKIQGPDK